MSRRGCRIFSFMTLLCVAPIAMPGQEGTQDNSKNTTMQQDETQKPQELRPSWINAGAPMEAHSFFNLGLSSSYGHDNAVNNLEGMSSQFNSVQGSLGVAHRSRNTSFALRHDATVLQFPGSDFELQQYQWTELHFTHLDSRKTTWGLSAANAYGADSARASSTVSLAAVSNLPTDNNSVQAGILSGNTLRQYFTLMADHKLSATRAFSLGTDVSFQNFLGAASSTHQYDLNGSLRQYWGQKLITGVRADAVQQNYGLANCTTGSLLGFATVQLSSNMQLDGSVGPAFGPGNCTGHYQYQVQASTQSVRRSRLYIGTSRRRGNGSVAGSLWETSAYGGVQAGNPRRLIMDLNGGYTSYHGGALSTMDSDVSGYYLSGEFHRPLGRYAELAFTARHFERTISGADLSRTVFFVALSWKTQNGGRDVY